jgi:hypothetical protein
LHAFAGERQQEFLSQRAGRADIFEYIFMVHAYPYQVSGFIMKLLPFPFSVK